MTAVVTFLLRVFALLPRRVAQSLGRLIGVLNYHLGTRAAQVTRANLELCLPDLVSNTLVRESLVETGRTMMETPAVWLAPIRQIDRWIAEVENESLITNTIAEGRGLLLVLPHAGNWELFNVFYRRYGSMTALYHPPRQVYMRQLMAEVRARHGNEMVPTDHSGLAKLYRRLQLGGTVVVLPDQVPASGSFAPFFGEMALTDDLVIRLARKTGASVVCVALLRREDGLFRVVLKKAPEGLVSDDKQEALTSLNHAIETVAKLAPAQYQWEYKRFRERPAGARMIYRFDRPDDVHR